MNPVEEFLEVLDGTEKIATKELKEKQGKEMDMWNQWNAGGRQPEHLQPLINSFKPLINSKVNIYTTKIRDIPPEAIRAEFLNQFVQAMQTYDPNRGAGLGTHVQHQLKKAQRFVTTYQNPGRIPENRIYKIRELQDAEMHLDDRFGRAPTQLELADHLKWSPRQVGLLQKEVRKARPTSQFENDPFAYTPSRQQEILRLLPYELTHDERAVFEYVYGIGGKPQLGTGDIATKLSMSPPKVSRLKASIAGKYRKHE
jgi:DNA-directed RNA polymerase specialized sigma subunit